MSNIVHVHCWADSHDHNLTWCGRKVRRCGDSHLRLPSLESTLNLQSTFFHHLNGDYLGAVEVNSQKPLLLLQHLLATAALTTQGQCSNFISPQERKSYLTFSPCDSLGRNLGQFTTELPSNISVFVSLSLIVKFVSIDCFIHGALTQFVLFPNTVAHRCSIKQNISKFTCVAIDGWPTKNEH